ncbi:MAG: non-homologous end-joining DNA ligase [Gemmatales bacterium]
MIRPLSLAGKVTRKSGFSYVVQKHDASHLHYDFRLEMDGVLKSWAVPKGPSLDPAIKRLAVQVEDHPVDYGSFEGTIPQGQYGGGTVMLWDRGTWEPLGDAEEGFRTGKLKFNLHGKKLQGHWMLLRTHGTKGKKEDNRSWLLMKERDSQAKSVDEGDVLEELPLSIKTGRDLNEIATGTKAKKTSKPLRPKRTGGLAPKKKHLAAMVKDYDAAQEEYSGVRLTSPDKVLYAEQGITKLDLAEYYRSMAPRILPHIKDRPLVLVRCPEGRSKECFFQKHPGIGTPKNLRQFPITEKNKRENYVLVDDAEGLISLAQIGALEIHAWGSRIDKLEQPDRLIFDLDPDITIDWSAVVSSARVIRDLLLKLGLESFVKTTGGKGLHLVVPIQRDLEWDEAKSFCKKLAEFIVSLDADHFTSNMSKAARHRKIFVDYLRNGRGATAIIPYSPRSRAGAPVACPINWQDLSPQVTSEQYTITNLRLRMSKLKHDPWAKLWTVRQSLKAASKKLNGIMK